MNISPLLAACNHVISERSASVSLLQRELRLSCSEAHQRVAALASAGVVEAPNPKGRYRIKLEPYMEQDFAATPAEVRARVLRDLALYLIECADGLNTECIFLISGSRGSKEHFAQIEARHQKSQNPTLDLALALDDSVPGERVDAIQLQRALGELCAEARPLPHHREGTKEERRIRSLVRAMRYLEQRLCEGGEPDSRSLDLFVARDLMSDGRARDLVATQQGHPEHVIPCLQLCKEATEMIRHGIPLLEVATWLEPFLRIVWIPKEAAAHLDGPMKLRQSMPAARWTAFGCGCMYARLHEAKILFISPEEGPECLCAENHVATLVKSA